MSAELENDDVLQVRVIHDGGLWCLVARVLEKPPTIVYVVAVSLPQAILEFRQNLAAVIDEADRHHEEFPELAAKLIAIRWRRLEFVEVAAPGRPKESDA